MNEYANEDLVERVCFEYNMLFRIQLSRHFDDDTVCVLITNSKGDIIYTDRHKGMLSALQDIKRYIKKIHDSTEVLLYKVNKLCDGCNNSVVS